MAPNRKHAVTGARSVLAGDQPSFLDEEPRRGKQFDGGRKVTDQPQVGAPAPDADAISTADATLVGMEKLAANNHAKVIDLLTERLVFERLGVKLYDAVLQKVLAIGDTEAQNLIDELQEIRDQEKEHTEWLEEQILALGGDTHGETDMSLLTVRESKGIEDIVLDGDNELSHLLHALLTAELADNAGWELLVVLADEAHDRDAKKAFKKRLHEEEEHLLFVRRAVQRLARRIVLGQDVSMPTAPGR
jgi:rubrerythrin